MTAPSPRLRTAWRVGSALAAAAGSAVVTSALVNRRRNRAQREPASRTPDAAPGTTPLDASPPPIAAPTTPVDAPPASGPLPATPAGSGVPPADGAELLVHDALAPSGGSLPRSDDLTRAIEAADAVEAAPAAWARAAEELRAQTADDPARVPPAAPPAAPATGASEVHVPSGPPTPAAGTAAALAAMAGGTAGGTAGGATLPPESPARDGSDDRAATVTTPPPVPVDDRGPFRPNGDAASEAGGEAGGEVTPDRRLLLAGIAVAVVVLLGLGVVVLGGGGDDDPEQAGASPTAGSGTDGTQPATTPGQLTPEQLTPAQAFAQAGERLETAGTFAYEGTSSATDVSPVRPGPWIGVNLTVEGQVQLRTPRLSERATAEDGSVAETVTDGVTIWGRSATSFDAFTEQSLQTLYTLPDPTPADVGALLLPRWFTSATGATDGGLDDLGRHTFRATLPASVVGTIEDDRAPVDAVVVLTLDEAGDPAHVEIGTGPAGPPLRLVFDIVGIGDDTPIQIPGDTVGAGTTAGSDAGTSTSTGAG